MGQQENAWCICSTHVDHIFCLCNAAWKKIRETLIHKTSVKIENLGPVSWALRTSDLRDREKGFINISKEAYVGNLLEKHQVVVSMPQQVPTHDSLFAPPSPTFEDQEIWPKPQVKILINHWCLMVADLNFRLSFTAASDSN